MIAFFALVRSGLSYEQLVWLTPHLVHGIIRLTFSKAVSSDEDRDRLKFLHAPPALLQDTGGALPHSSSLSLILKLSSSILDSLEQRTAGFEEVQAA